MNHNPTGWRIGCCRKISLRMLGWLRSKPSIKLLFENSQALWLSTKVSFTPMYTLIFIKRIMKRVSFFLGSPYASFIVFNNCLYACLYKSSICHSHLFVKVWLHSSVFGFTKCRIHNLSFMLFITFALKEKQITVCIQEKRDLITSI